MRCVLDASVALKWVLSEEHSDFANALREQHRNGVCTFIAPDIFPLEVAHALTRAERKGLLQPPEASILTADILTTPPALHSSIDLLTRALEISSQMRVGIYDCLYVALAEDEGCELVSADEKLLVSLPGYPIRH